MQLTEEEKLAGCSSAYEELAKKMFACEDTGIVITDCDTSDAEACKMMRDRNTELMNTFDVLTDAADKDKRRQQEQAADRQLKVCPGMQLRLHPAGIRRDERIHVRSS